MGVARDRSNAFAAVARIRELQSRAGEIQLLRAVNAHRAAKERHDGCVLALADTQAGWARAMESGSFNHEIARHWFAALARDHEEERQLEAQVDSARAVLDGDRAAWQAAAARADAALEQARAAAKQVGRQREDRRVAALEDRAAARHLRS